MSDKPEKPTLTLNESDIQASYIKITWAPPTDSGGNPVLDYRVIVSGAANQTLEGVLCSEKLIEKLTPGKSYTVTVSARNSVGYGESDGWSFTTKSEGKVIILQLLTKHCLYVTTTRIHFFLNVSLFKRTKANQGGR